MAKLGGWIVGVCVMMLLGGCGLTGVGATKKAVYTLPKEKRILVFVDIHSTVAAPSGFASKLGESIGSELYKFGVVDRLAGQARLEELRRDPESFQKMGIADVARATDSDLVLHVDLITFNVGTLSEDALTQGMAQVLVKVVDSNGKRLWPVDDAVGTQVDEKVEPKYTEDQDKAAVTKQLNDKLAEDVARFFHNYNPSNGELAKQTVEK